jgi:hypothetical protein
MANGSRHSIAYASEGTYATAATTGFKTLRGGRTTLALSKDVLESEELRSDRQIADQTHGTYNVAGDVPIELSYDSFDDLIEAALGGTWSTNVLKAGTTRRSFTIQRHFADLGDNPFHVFTGCEVDSFSLEVAPNAKVTGAFSLLGSGFVTQAATQGVVAAPNTNATMSSFEGALLEGGSPVAVVTSINLNLENGLETRFVVGQKETIRPQIGRSNVSGEITAFFESSALLNKFINETESSLAIQLDDVDGNQYLIELPRIKYNSGSTPVQNEGAISITLSFQALYDQAEATNIKITRTPV